MSFLKKRRLKRNAKDMVSCVLLICKRILEQGWEFQGEPTNQQLNSVYIQNVKSDEYLRVQHWGLWGAFEGGAMSLELVKNHIVLPLLCAYTPPHINGKILMCHFAHELACLEDDENMRSTIPDPDLVTVWSQIAADVIGADAYNLTFKVFSGNPAKTPLDIASLNPFSTEGINSLGILPPLISLIN